ETISLGLVRFPLLPYWKAIRAKNRIFQVLQPLLSQRKESPAGDGVSRMLTAESSNGMTLSVDEAVLEIHHAIIAGFIVFGQLASAVLYSNPQGQVRNRLIHEMQSIPL